MKKVNVFVVFLICLCSTAMFGQNNIDDRKNVLGGLFDSPYEKKLSNRQVESCVEYVKISSWESIDTLGEVFTSDREWVEGPEIFKSVDTSIKQRPQGYKCYLPKINTQRRICNNTGIIQVRSLQYNYAPDTSKLQFVDIYKRFLRDSKVNRSR